MDFTSDTVGKEEGDVYLNRVSMVNHEEEAAELSINKVALKESQWANIMHITTPQQLEQQKGSSSPSQSVTATSPSDEENRSPLTSPSDSENRPPSAPNSSEAWKERCEVITVDQHRDYVAFASEIVRNLVDELRIESDDSVINVSSDTRSLCSSDLSPSDTSFNTAKEEDDRDLLSSVEKTDTEFESVEEDERSDSDSYSYDRCNTVVTVRSSNVLVDAGHDLLCKPIFCDFDQLVADSELNPTTDLSLVEERDGSEDAAIVESGVTPEAEDSDDTLLKDNPPCEIPSVLPDIVPVLSVDLSGELSVESEQATALEFAVSENVSNAEAVESESILENSSGFDGSFVILESKLDTQSNESSTGSSFVILEEVEGKLDPTSNGSRNSFIEAIEQPTVLPPGDVSTVEHLVSDVEEAKLDSETDSIDDLKETSSRDPKNLNDQTIPSYSDLEDLVSLSEPQTDSCFEPDLNSGSLEGRKTHLLFEVKESVDLLVIQEEPDALAPVLSVSTAVDSLEISSISNVPPVIRLEFEDPVVSPVSSADNVSKLEFSSEFFESFLPIGDSLSTDKDFPVVQNTDAVDSVLNVSFASVSSLSKEPSLCSIDSKRDETVIVNAEKSIFDEPLKVEKQSEENGKPEDRLSSWCSSTGALQPELVPQETPDSLIDIAKPPSSSTVDALNDVEFEQILRVESSYIVEELFNLSQRSNEFEVETKSITPMPTAESQPSEDVLADVENNEGTVALGLDVNINPFESRPKLSSSTQRCLSPVDNEGTIEDNEQKTEASPKLAPISNLGMSNESPKRRSSDTNPSDVEPCSSDSPKDGAIDENSDLFKVPGKVTTSPTPDTDDAPTQQCLMESSMSEDSGIDVPPASRPRSSASTAVEEGCAMTQSIEGRSAVNFSEAGPDVADCKQEEFRSATDFFMDPSSLDFLEKCDSGKFAESALSRMSLYMKFDPLVPGNSPMSRRLTMWLKQQQEAANRDTKTGSELPESPPKSSDTTLQFEGQKLIDLEASPLKLGSLDGPTLINTSLASGEPMPQQEDVKKLSDEEVRQMLKIQELLFQDRQLMKDREWDDKLKAIEMEKQQLSAQVQLLRESQHQMRQIVGEYEKTISQLISDKEHDKQMMTESASQVTKERDQALEDLQNVETAFGDLHRRYEKAKTAVEGFKKNEDTLKGCVNDLQTKLKRQVEKYELLRNRAEERLESANVQIENMGKANESEVAALRAQLKKSEMMVNGLENTLEQKVKENAELTNICDELIAQVGHKT